MQTPVMEEKQGVTGWHTDENCQAGLLVLTQWHESHSLFLLPYQNVLA